jgi:hypothetical protein
VKVEGLHRASSSGMASKVFKSFRTFLVDWLLALAATGDYAVITLHLGRRAMTALTHFRASLFAFL